MSFHWRHPAAWADQPLLRRALVTTLALLLIAASAWLGFSLSLRQGIASSRAESNHRLDLFASAVNGVVKRLEPIPATIQLNQDVLALLREPANGPRLRAVNDYLRRLNAHVGSIGAFVLNDRGVVVASSNNAAGDDSSPGEDISFRPYFLEALSGRVGRHFAIGIKGHQPGYFVSHPIHDGARVVGVAAIKISLAPIDQTWEMLGAPGLLADTNQVVIMASNPAWRYTALTELPLERRVDLQLTRMYNNLRVPRFPLDAELLADDSFRLLPQGIPGVKRARRAAPADTMVLARPLDGMDWRLMLFVDMAGVRSTALLSGFMAAVAAGFVVLLGVHLAQRRRILRQRLEAEHLLERVNAELELKVTGRTLDLTEANARLRTEVGEREQAENNLRAAQSELVHAAKMAMLGQLATSITHELTQPLGAIRTLSGNAVEFHKRGDDTALLGNLKIIARLADQMGGIIQPLKGFARKTQPVASRADVALAVGNALFLYDLPLRKGAVQVVNRCAAGKASAWCDANRLEQVLINLIGNAIDAMRGATQRTLTLDACTAPPPRLTADVHGTAGAVAADCTAIGNQLEQGAPVGGAWVRIDVLDSGPGLSADVQARLFEPFFTTKASGTGLGLGLVISRDIVREFGGDIEAASRPEGGARFSVYLPAVMTSPPAAPNPATALTRLEDPASMPPELTVLLVEDDPHVQLGCVQALQLAGLRVHAAASAEEVLRSIKPGFAGVVVTDMRLPGADGLSLIRHCKEVDPELPAIMITGHGDMSLAVEAMRSGAYDFIPKPFSPELLVEVVRRALEKRALTLEVVALRRALHNRQGVDSKLIGRSPQMNRVRRLVAEVAQSPVDVLIQGETGTGKELVAQALHDLSQRKGGHFVPLNCGGMPDNLLDSELFGHEAGAFTGAQKRRVGKIEFAHGGTLFLDELESMPMGMQVKLLRVLQERVIERLGSNSRVPVDVRVVAATKDNLLARVRDNSFRPDLYYRLNVVAIDLPTLRERREDIPLLLEHFMLLAASRYARAQPAVPQDLMRRLMAHAWPGNVRELRNVAECLVLGVPTTQFGVAGAAQDAPDSETAELGDGSPGGHGSHGGTSLVETVEGFERSLIAAELERHDGSITRSARALRIAKTTLTDKVRKYGLQ